MNEIETIVGAKEDYVKLIYDARQKYKRDIAEILLRAKAELKGEDRTIMLQRCLDQMQMMECLAMQDQNTMLLEIVQSVNDHIKVGCMSETEYNHLQKKWEKTGFQSRDIKDFVLAVRKTFFDDNREEYQFFDCVNIRFSSFFGDEYVVDLTFRAGENLSSREFNICLPVKGTVKCDSRAQTVRGRMSVKVYEREDNELNKYIRNDGKYIISSYKVEDVKDRLAKYVLEDDRTEFDFDLVRNFLCKSRMSGWHRSCEWNDSMYTAESGDTYKIYNYDLTRFRSAFGIDYGWA